jgi:hypothetical protein
MHSGEVRLPALNLKHIDAASRYALPNIVMIGPSSEENEATTITGCETLNNAGTRQAQRHAYQQLPERWHSAIRTASESVRLARSTRNGPLSPS